MTKADHRCRTWTTRAWNTAQAAEGALTAATTRRTQLQTKFNDDKAELTRLKNAPRSWQGDRKLQAAQKQAEEFAAAVTPGASLATVAADKKLTVSTSPPFGRKQEAGSTVPPVLIGKLFAAKQGDVVTVEDATGAYVAQLKEIQIPQPPADGPPSALQNELTTGFRTDVATEFTNALRNRYKVEIDRTAVDRMF